MPDKPPAAPFLCILDCATGERVAVHKSPFVIGTLPSSDLRLSSPSAPQVLCTIVRADGGWDIRFVDQVLVNGSASERLQSMSGDEHSVVGRGCMLALKHTEKAEVWLSHCVTLLWSVYDTSVHDWLGPFGLPQLRSWIGRLTEDARRHIVLVPAGMEEVGFFVRDVQELLSLGGVRDRSLEEQAWYRRQKMEDEKRALRS